MKRITVAGTLLTVALAFAGFGTSIADASASTQAGGHGTASAAPTRIDLTRPGTYTLANGSSVTISVSPVYTMTKTGSDGPPGARPGSSYWCRTANWQFNEISELTDFLVTGLCWNNHTASAYNVQTGCSTFVVNGNTPGTCGPRTSGINCNWCATVGVWGNYFQSCWFGSMPCNLAIGIWGNQYGRWWGNSWAI